MNYLPRGLPVPPSPRGTTWHNTGFQGEHLTHFHTTTWRLLMWKAQVVTTDHMARRAVAGLPSQVQAQGIWSPHSHPNLPGSQAVGFSLGRENPHFPCQPRPTEQASVNPRLGDS